MWFHTYLDRIYTQSKPRGDQNAKPTPLGASFALRDYRPWGEGDKTVLIVNGSAVYTRRFCNLNRAKIIEIRVYIYRVSRTHLRPVIYDGNRRTRDFTENSHNIEYRILQSASEIKKSTSENRPVTYCGGVWGLVFTTVYVIKRAVFLNIWKRALDGNDNKELRKGLETKGSKT